MQKILIIRFSSIGDIVLTTPVIRCLKEQVPHAQIHYVTKEVFKPVLEHNPYLDKIHTFKKDVAEIYEELANEKFTLLIDLHKNLRSVRLRQKLKVLSYAFNKINLQKFVAVNFKLLNRLPQQHIVDRYFEAVSKLVVNNDGKGLDYFISESDKVKPPELPEGKFVALVVGGSYYTKQIPLTKLQVICELSRLPLVLMGGKEDALIAKKLQDQFPALINACGNYSINQSASIISQAEWVITSDTGLMHIASAFHKKIISVWGNTIPEFGMGPYLPAAGSRIVEVKNLACRPCSKLGYHKCPIAHFHCMNQNDLSFVAELS